MRFLFLWIVFCCCVFAEATAYSPQILPDPKTYCAECFVSNPDNIISRETEQKLNALLLDLYKKSEVEVAVVAINDITTDDYFKFAHDLFQTWNIGKAGKNTGVLLLLIKNERAVKIETGYGVEGLLPDAVCEDILNNYIFPSFKAGDYDTGFYLGIQQVANILTSQEALEELLLEVNNYEISDVSSFILSYLILAFLVLIIMILIAYKVLNFNKNASNNVRYNHISSFYNLNWVVTILFLFPMLFFQIWLKKKRNETRTKPIKCGECGHMMTLLSEREEDKYLDSRKQTEEKLKSIDYDVWECKSCLNHIILPYEYKLTGYSKCSQCGAKTLHLQSDVIRQHATQFAAGKGEKTYLCEHCKTKTVKTYTIPRVPIVVSSGNRGRSGGFNGGFSGGSWGGGFSGGGGAGGRF